MNNNQIIPPDVSWKDITEGGTISAAGNAKCFKTGAWKSISPEFIPKMHTMFTMCTYVSR